MEIDQLGRLRDILEACVLIESYVAGASRSGKCVACAISLRTITVT